MAEIEIVPAILSKDVDDLKKKLAAVDFAPILQIDFMDGKFVDNKTVGLEIVELLPKEKIIEYHLMVENPIEWIDKLPSGQNSIFQIHVETLDCDKAKIAKDLVKKKGSRICAVLNPESKIDRLEHCKGEFEEILVMTVHPGKSGQTYIHEMGSKITQLREKYPDIIIEVDGGVNENTIAHAVRAGANRLAAASALFEHKDTKAAFEKLEKIANDARSE